MYFLFFSGREQNQVTGQHELGFGRSMKIVPTGLPDLSESQKLRTTKILEQTI